MTSKFICGVMENYDPAKFLHSSKDLLEKVLPVIIQLTKDSSPDARYYARRSLNVLWPEPDFLQVASRVLKNNLFADAKEAVETIKMKVSLREEEGEGGRRGREGGRRGREGGREREGGGGEGGRRGREREGGGGEGGRRGRE